jgi:hypothetical protein
MQCIDPVAFHSVFWGMVFTNIMIVFIVVCAMNIAQRQR